MTPARPTALPLDETPEEQAAWAEAIAQKSAVLDALALDALDALAAAPADADDASW